MTGYPCHHFHFNPYHLFATGILKRSGSIAIVSLRGLTSRRGKCYTSSSFASVRKGAPARCRSAGRLVIERGEGIMRSESAIVIRSYRFLRPRAVFLFRHTSRLGGIWRGDAFFHGEETCFSGVRVEKKRGYGYAHNL